jgi:hypothetical protein
MKPEKALELVTRYATLTKQIKALKKAIGENMDACKGISGERGLPLSVVKMDNKGRDIDLHLWFWYQPEYDDYENRFYEEIKPEIHGVQCPHCYAAHLAIQERKAARRSLGTVKAAMTRSAA